MCAVSLMIGIGQNKYHFEVPGSRGTHFDHPFGNMFVFNRDYLWYESSCVQGVSPKADNIIDHNNDGVTSAFLFNSQWKLFSDTKGY